MCCHDLRSSDNANSVFRKVSLSQSVLLMLWLTHWATALMSIVLLRDFVPTLSYNWQSNSNIFERAIIKSSVSGVWVTTEEYVQLACITWSIIRESASLGNTFKFWNLHIIHIYFASQKYTVTVIKDLQ